MKQRCAVFVVFILALAVALAGPPARPNVQSAGAGPSQNTVPARFSLGGNAAQIPAQFSDNLIFLPVSLNGGKPSFFELDSSGNPTNADPSRVPAASDSAALPAAIANCSLNLPGLELPMNLLPVSPRNEFGAQLGVAYQGTLGADFFARVVVVVDYARETVQLYDPAIYTYTGQGKSLPLKFAGNIPLVRAKFLIPGQRALEADFEVNTALDAAVMFSSAYTDAHRISAAHFRAAAASYPALDGGAKIFLGRLKGFQLGPYAVEDVVAAFSQKGLPGVDKSVAGSIGGGFFRRFTVVFDFPHQRMIVDANLQINKFAEEDMSGLSIVAKGAGLKTFEIVQVQQGTPGANAGIQPGDIISGIDDEPAADLTLLSVRDLFRQVGHKYKLLIERDGKTREVVVQMRRLV
jgi:PDZ domain-containing protein